MSDKLTAKVVDFSNVKDGGGNFKKSRIPAGDYLARVVKCEDAEAKGDGVFQYLFTLQVTAHPSNRYPYYCKLQENQLWKLRNLLIAAGINVPKKRVKLDPSKVVGKTVGVTMEDDEYEGKAQSTVASIFPASELSGAPEEDADASLSAGDEGEEEEAEVATTTDDEEEEEDEATTDPFADMDRTALKKFLTNADPNFKARKSQSDDDLRELARAVPVDADVDEDDELEELDISDV